MTDRTPPLAERTPPGQHIVETLPVLDLGIRPDIHPEAWRLRLFGAVTQERVLDWATLMRLPPTPLVADFHCVTRWSRLDTAWDGVPAWRIAALATPLPEARFITLHGYDGYTANLPIEALMAGDTLLAYRLSGQPLPREHGGPVRLLAPQRYGWKSVKWLTSIEFHIEDRPGFWETRGYHHDADPWREERFRAA